MEALDFPSRIQIQTINRCNYACGMCPYPETAEGTRLAYFDEAVFQRLIGEVRQAGRRVRLCLMLQNEPLLDRRFLAFLRHAHDAEDVVASVSTVTNGSTLTPELLDQLTAFERLRLSVSVNANDRETYLRIHQRDLWEKIHGLLCGWQGRRDRVRVSFVFDASTIAQAIEFRRRWARAGYSTRLVAINARVDSLAGEGLFHRVDEDFGHCTYPVDTLTVLVDGTVILCCNDWDHRIHFGNLRSASISAIWNSPRFVELRGAALDGTLREFEVCRTCDYPMRSAERFHLEAALAGAPTPEPCPGDLLEHAGELRSRDGEAVQPVLICAVREESGTVLALASGPVGDLPEEILFRFNLAFSGVCTFASLEPVWCPARLRRLPRVADLAGASPLEIALDRSAPEYRFFRWYSADWRVPNINPLQDLERRSHGETTAGC